jgi:hypothetical protein
MLAAKRTPVLICATDPILRSGVATPRTRDEVWLVGDDQTDVAPVVLLVADRLDEAPCRARTGFA